MYSPGGGLEWGPHSLGEGACAMPTPSPQVPETHTPPSGASSFSWGPWTPPPTAPYPAHIR